MPGVGFLALSNGLIYQPQKNGEERGVVFFRYATFFQRAYCVHLLQNVAVATAILAEICQEVAHIAQVFHTKCIKLVRKLLKLLLLLRSQTCVRLSNVCGKLGEVLLLIGRGLQRPLEGHVLNSTIALHCRSL